MKPPQQTPGRGATIVSLVCGGVAFLLMFPFGVFFFYTFPLIAVAGGLGLGFGVAAVRGIRTRGNKALGVLGLVLSGVSLLVLAAFVIGWLLFPLLAAPHTRPY